MNFECGFFARGVVVRMVPESSIHGLGIQGHLALEVNPR